MRRYRERLAPSERLRRLEQAADALVAMIGGDTGSALKTLRSLAAEAMAEDFDLEVANITLALWARLPAPTRPAGEHEALLERIGMRFCSSKAIAEALAAAARREETALAVIRRSQGRISALAEKAMEQALLGDPAAAARQLLAAGEQCLNAKLLEMAGLIARRHEAGIPDAQSIAEQVTAAMRRNCRAQSHIAGIQRSGRSPGGLQMRGPNPIAVTDAD